MTAPTIDQQTGDGLTPTVRAMRDELAEHYKGANPPSIDKAVAAVRPGSSNPKSWDSRGMAGEAVRAYRADIGVEAKPVPVRKPAVRTAPAKPRRTEPRPAAADAVRDPDRTAVQPDAVPQPPTPVQPDPQPAVRTAPGAPDPLKQLLRIRWAVRAVLGLGVAASIAGNVLHAEDNLISQIISAWSPLALLLTIELISRVPVHSRRLAFARWVATAIIAGIAAWVSYWHMAAVASRYGETGGAQYLLPLSVDGLVVVASICLLELGGRIASAKREV